MTDIRFAMGCFFFVGWHRKLLSDLGHLDRLELLIGEGAEYFDSARYL